MEANATKDYAQQAIEIIGTDLTQQMSSNLITAVLIDVAWKKAAREMLGEEKALELDCNAWSHLGREGTRHTMKAMGIEKMEDLATLKKVILAQLTSFLVRMTTVEESEDRVLIEVQGCPFPTYAVAHSDVELGDWTCKAWVEETRRFFDTVIEEGGLAGVVKGDVIKSMCTGDDHCEFLFEKTD